VERVDRQALEKRNQAREDAQRARQRLFIIVPIAALLTLLAAVALGWYLTRTVTGPLTVLTASAEALARGDFQHEVQLQGNNELAVLGSAFNYAAQQLQKFYEHLRRSERELRGVINTVPAHVWSASPDGTVDFVNERLVEFVGLSSNDILGWKCESIVHSDDRGKFVTNWSAAFKDGHSIESEVRVRRADGQHCWFFVRNVPVRDEAGNIAKWYGSGIEIEDLKRAEEERERLRQLQSELAHIHRVTTMAELAASIARD
jgi:PAS domain S-box-containing protein